VVIPRGCVLLQVAQQWERVTGGHFLAGFHEVVTVPEHERFRLVAESAGMQAWRCATVVFGAAGSDQVLRPLGPFATREAEERYPGMFAALSTARKLVKIGMMPAAVLAGIEEQAIAWPDTSFKSGKVDDVRYWNVALTGAEVATLYAQGRT
jgi:hypothetical protein